MERNQRPPRSPALASFAAAYSSKSARPPGSGSVGVRPDGGRLSHPQGSLRSLSSSAHEGDGRAADSRRSSYASHPRAPSLLAHIGTNERPDRGSAKKDSLGGGLEEGAKPRDSFVRVNSLVTSKLYARHARLSTLSTQRQGHKDGLDMQPRTARSQLVRRLAWFSRQLSIWDAIVSNMLVVLESMDGPNNGSADPAFPFLFHDEQYRNMVHAILVVALLGAVINIFVLGSVRAWIKLPETWLDIISGLSLFVATLESLPQGILAVARVGRLLRILKAALLFPGFPVLTDAVRMSVRPLAVPMFFFSIFALMFATIFVFVDPCMDSESCPFSNVLESLYFVIVTMTSVGYGDQYPTPTNFWSRVVATIVLIFGSLYLAMPLAIIGNNFEAAWRNQARDMNLERMSALARSKVQHMATKLMRKEEDIALKKSHYQAMDNYLDLSYELALLESQVLRLPSGKKKSKELVAVLERTQGEIMSTCTRAIEKQQKFYMEMKVFLGPLPQEKVFRLISARKSAKKWIKKVAERKVERQKTQASMGLQRAESDAPPSSLRNTIFEIMEKPGASTIGLWVHRFLLFLTLISILAFLGQMMPELQVFGEETVACRDVVAKYCGRASSTFDTDPGCFVNSYNNSGAGPIPLDFTCIGNEKPNCYGAGTNFGSKAPNFPCDEAFADSIGIHGRGNMAIQNICSRPQCNNDHQTLFLGAELWAPLEFTLCAVFTVELVARFIVAPKRRYFLNNVMNLVDLIALLPTYIEIVQSARTGSTVSFDVTSMDPTFTAYIKTFKILRIFKLSRRFNGTAILLQTFQKSFHKLTVPLGLLLCFLLFFGNILYELELGHVCFFGSPCVVDNKEYNLTEIFGVEALNGTRVQFVDNGDHALIHDQFDAAWWSVATTTSVGFGDVFPMTTLGKIVGAILMIFGVFYIAMPLSLVGGQFYSLYQEQVEYDKTLKRVYSQNKNPDWMKKHHIHSWNMYTEVKHQLPGILESVKELSLGRRKSMLSARRVMRVAPSVQNATTREDLLARIRLIQDLHARIGTIVTHVKRDGIV